MSQLDKVLSYLANDPSIEMRTKKTLQKCFQAVADGGSGVIDEITSPGDSIDVVNTAGDVTIDINGNPPADGTKTLGSSAARWNAIVLTEDAPIDFDDGAGNSNRIVYTDGTGPTFTDKTVSESLTFNVQDFTDSRTATFQDSNGTVAWLTDTFDTSAPLIINPTTGQTIVTMSGGTSDSVNNIFVVPAGDLLAFTMGIGDGEGGNVLYITFTHAITTMSWTGSNFTNECLTKPSTIIAGQCVSFVWDDGSNLGGATGWACFKTS